MLLSSSSTFSVVGVGGRQRDAVRDRRAVALLALGGAEALQEDLDRGLGAAGGLALDRGERLAAQDVDLDRAWSPPRRRRARAGRRRKEEKSAHHGKSDNVRKRDARARTAGGGSNRHGRVEGAGPDLCRSASGAPCARTTAATATPGTLHRTTRLARSAYRWGEDGLAGVCDDQQRLCFALALWNGRDPILKERIFGLTNGEGNHGEDAKEYWFYLDCTPTHSYMK